ncbi:hypothetical protein ASPFODRAFT_704797 [Aspergillus luchuensis CBS 106.47]|uniref:Uncharacterized protein n=1 Tax=Aspergillus luchuensis (strain CBS 106.47) TaxID=1137211 RepID=A0A1M3T1D0_ASPLC|nr:hypothetical protein ASPFODRAFT_704797 [Aspergillus luchuensis CBS 106.47]
MGGIVVPHWGQATQYFRPGSYGSTCHSVLDGMRYRFTFQCPPKNYDTTVGYSWYDSMTSMLGFDGSFWRLGGGYGKSNCCAHCHYTSPTKLECCLKSKL